MSLVAWDTSQERLQLFATASLGAGLFLSDSGTAVAVLGILGTVLTNRDLVLLYLVFTPLSVLNDLIWLLTGHPGKLSVALAVVLLCIKALGCWFAYDVVSSTESRGPAMGEYQPFGNPSPTRARDPFDRFAQSAQGMPSVVQPQPQPQPQYQPPPPPPAAAQQLVQPPQQGTSMLEG